MSPLRARDLDAGLEPVDESRTSSNRPMFEMTIRLFGWQRGEAEIETTLFDGGLLEDPFRVPSPEADTVLARLHARLEEEVAEAFEILRRC